MLNATVSHEMRGPISSMAQNIERQSNDLQEITKDFDQLKYDLKNMKKIAIPS
jgi:septal ring factor EnvC (AmiA/AmiB activator)